MDDSADISDESSLEHRREEDNVRLNESMQEESYSCSRCCHFPCSPQQLLSCRRILAIMSFVGFSCAYALRVNLSVALVAMLNDTEGENNTWKYEWRDDSTVKGVILGSFFYGYITTQLLGGWLSQRFGGKRIFGYGILCTAVVSLFSPLAVNTNVWLLVTLRILEGIGEGVTFSAMHTLLGQWAPPLEISILSTIAYSGIFAGTVVALPISGLLSGTLGWPSVFYVFGTAGILWWLFWCVLVYDTPSSHPRISKEEREYLEETVSHDKRKLAVPVSLWLTFFRSRPVWAIIIAHVCNNFGLYTLLFTLPTYFDGVYGYNIKSNGLVSGLPYLCLWIVTLLSGKIADGLRQTGRLSTTKTRKLFNSLGFLSGAVFLVILAYARNRAEAVTFVTLSVGLTGWSQAGFLVNHLDIAPRYAGLLMGIGNTLATVPGFAGPEMAEAIAHSEHDIPKLQQQWRTVFFTLAAIYVVGAIVYVAFASGEKQSWADGIVEKEDSYEFHELEEEVAEDGTETYRRLDTNDG